VAVVQLPLKWRQSFILYLNYHICTCPIRVVHFKINVVHLDTLLKESVNWKINTSVWFRCMRKKSLMEDKRNNVGQRPLTRRNPKRRIPLVSLLLWRKMVAVHPFIWVLGLWLWSVRQWDEILTFLVIFLKFYIRPPVNDFVFLKMYFMRKGTHDI